MTELAEFVPFNFSVNLLGEKGDILCSGMFSEVSGLEMNMEPYAIQEGGKTWGETQRVGYTKFSPIVLRRGVTHVNDLWAWFDTTAQLDYGQRMQGTIDVLSNHIELDKEGTTQERKILMTWSLVNVLPTRFKGADLSSTASQVAIEEVTLIHESIRLIVPKAKGAA